MLSKALVPLLAAATFLVVAQPGRLLLPDQPNWNYGVIVPMPVLTKPTNTQPTGDVLTFLRDLSNTDPLKKTHLDVGAIRVDLFWSEIQPVQGGPLTIPVSTQAAIHAAIADKKLHVFASLSSSPSWAASCPGCKPKDAASMTAWAAFVSKALTTFQGDLANMTFGIWNEPDLHSFTPADYQQLYDAANLARTGPTAGVRFAVPETAAGAVNINLFNAPDSWLASTLKLLALKDQDVITVHWYPGNRSQELPIYMDKVLRTAGTRETWLTETGEIKDEDDEQQATIGAILDVFNRRPSTQWSKVFIYRLFGDDDYNLMKIRTVSGVDELRGRESFFTFHRKIRTFAVNLLTDNAHWVSAPHDGSGSVKANAATPGPSETFVLEDLDGEGLQEGDVVTIRAPGGMNFRAIGTSHVIAVVSDCACTVYDRFIIEAGLPGTGTRVAFRSESSGLYVSRGGFWTGQRLFATTPTIGAHQTFQLVVR